MSEDVASPIVNTADDVERDAEPSPRHPPAEDDVNNADDFERASNLSPPHPRAEGDGTLLSPPSTTETEPVKTDDRRWDWNTKVLWRQKWRILSYEKKGAQSTTM